MAVNLLGPAFAESTVGVMALLTLKTQAAMAQRSDIIAGQLFSRQNPGKHQVQDGDLMINAAGRHPQMTAITRQTSAGTIA